MPVITIVGSAIGSTIFSFLIKLSLSFAGWVPDDWMYKVLITAGQSANIGWLVVWLASASAPSRKLQVVKIVALIVSIFVCVSLISSVIIGEQALGFVALESFALCLGVAIAFHSTRTNESRHEFS